MTDLPDDQIDAYEPRLARRVGDFAEQAVRPFDATAVAAAAHAGARRRGVGARLFGSSGAMARYGLVLAGALLAATAFGIYLSAGGPVVTQPTTPSPIAATTDVPGGTACRADDLDASISGWDGAAGHRIATVDVRNRTANECALPALLRPALVDAEGTALIAGAPVSDTATIRLARGRGATTEIDMANYCGAAPSAALRIRLYLPSQESVEAAANPGLNALDLPPCNGETVPASIEMQPFRLAN
jgi:hypothetical protein